jgi:hypothetical protein
VAIEEARNNDFQDAVMIVRNVKKYTPPVVDPPPDSDPPLDPLLDQPTLVDELLGS